MASVAVLGLMRSEQHLDLSAHQSVKLINSKMREKDLMVLCIKQVKEPRFAMISCNLSITVFKPNQLVALLT